MMPADCKPACADPELLPLVDLAFERSKEGNAAGRELVEVACKRCDVRDQCLYELVARPSHGVWGGGRRKLNTNRDAVGPIKVVAA